MDAALTDQQESYRENWTPYIVDLSQAQHTVLEQNFHQGLMVGRESVWAGLDYTEAVALNPYKKKEEEQ